MIALAWLKDNWRLVLFLLVLGALGVQSYRLQGTQAAYTLYKAEQEAQEKERVTEGARQVAFDKFNKRKTDEAYRAALARIPVNGVRDDKHEQPFAQARTPGGGDEPTYCGTGADINRELSEFSRRHAERLGILASASAKVAAAYEACKSYALGLDALTPQGSPAPRAPDAGPAPGVVAAPKEADPPT